MNRSFGLSVVGLVAVAASALFGSAGCQTQVPEMEKKATTTQHETGEGGGSGDGSGECGYYEKRSCDPTEVISYYEKDVKSLLYDVAGCTSCAAFVTGSAITAVGGSVASDGLLSVPASALARTIAAAGCGACWKSVEDSGLLRSLDCALFPCQYSTEGRQKECEQICDTTYAYVPQVGYACQCTNNATEARCRLSCYDGFQINDQCGCDKIPDPPPPPPAPECSNSGDGYSCSSDPDTWRDRACCHNQCVIWECSACDDNPYCPGR